jgi:hypothetical protein
MIITGRTAGEQNLLVRAVDGNLGTHTRSASATDPGAPIRTC